MGGGTVDLGRLVGQIVGGDWLRSVVPLVLWTYVGQLPKPSSVQSSSIPGVPEMPVLPEFNWPRARL